MSILHEKTRGEWLDLLHRCQNGEATCLYTLKQFEAEHVPLSAVRDLLRQVTAIQRDIKAAHGGNGAVAPRLTHLEEEIRSLLAPVSAVQTPAPLCRGLDNPRQVFFYEQDFYVLSNFSSFCVMIEGRDFSTAEHAYHWHKFAETDPRMARHIQQCRSAHDAFKLAQECRELVRLDWDSIKLDVMRRIIRAKTQQHTYVRRKLLATGDRELIENSWRDDFWGWGADHCGQNWLGRLWMELRAELRGEKAP